MDKIVLEEEECDAAVWLRKDQIKDICEKTNGDQTCPGIVLHDGFLSSQY